MANLIFSSRKTNTPKNDSAATLRLEFAQFVLDKAAKTTNNDPTLLALTDTVFGNRTYHDNNNAPGPHQIQFEKALLVYLEPVNQSSYKKP